MEYSKKKYEHEFSFQCGNVPCNHITLCLHTVNNVNMYATVTPPPTRPRRDVFNKNRFTVDLLATNKSEKPYFL